MSAHAQTGCQKVFIGTQRLYAHNSAAPSETAEPLESGAPLGTVTYRARGAAAANSLDDYLRMFCTTGFLVLHDGKVVFERHLQGTRPDDGLLSASMSKTVLALLIGIAVGEGKLALNERVREVLPDLADSAFGPATVEDLLRMSSGVELKNSYQRGDTSDNLAPNPIINPRQNIRDYLRSKTSAGAPGSTFAYNSAVTALLGLMLSARTGMSNTDFLAHRLWGPMGTQGPAYWIKNFHGEEGVQGQFVATLRDYGRLGLLVMNQGAAGGRSLVAPEWITQMTALRTDKPQPVRAPYYGLHIWIPQAAGGRSFFWGTNGQNIFVDPVAKVVIVHTGNSPDAEFNGNAHLFPLRDAIVRKLAGH